MMLLLLALATSLNVNAYEARKRVVVIDTGYDIKSLGNLACADGHADVTGTGMKDRHGHGTEMVDIIKTAVNPATHCITIIKWYDVSMKGAAASVQTQHSAGAMAMAGRLYPAIINMSYSGEGGESEERAAFLFLLRSNARLVIAAGNDDLDLGHRCSIYPACYAPFDPKVDVVGAGKAQGLKSRSSNYGHPVRYWRDAPDTSHATAMQTAWRLKNDRK